MSDDEPDARGVDVIAVLACFRKQAAGHVSRVFFTVPCSDCGAKNSNPAMHSGL